MSRTLGGVRVYSRLHHTNRRPQKSFMSQNSREGSVQKFIYDHSNSARNSKFRNLFWNQSVGNLEFTDAHASGYIYSSYSLYNILPFYPPIRLIRYLPNAACQCHTVQLLPILLLDLQRPRPVESTGALFDAARRSSRSSRSSLRCSFKALRLTIFQSTT